MSDVLYGLVIAVTAWLLLLLGFDALEAQIEGWPVDDDGR